jgi:hypothetical protein
MSTRSMLTFPTTVERASVYSRLTQSHQTWAEGWAGGAYPVLALPGPRILPKSRQVMYTRTALSLSGRYETLTYSPITSLSLI